MSCSPPITESLGFLYIDYIHTTQSIDHRTHCRLVGGVGPNDTGTLIVFAEAWRDALQRLVPAQFTIIGWGTQDNNGHIFSQFAFVTPAVGIHAAATGALDYASRSVTFTGHGDPGTVGQCAGEARSVVFCGQAFEFIPRQKYLVAGADTAADGVAAFLADPAVPIWGDFYGDKAGVRGRYPLQFNAYQQRHNGT